MEAAVALFVVFLAVILAVPAWMIWDFKTNPEWHRSFCTCPKCNENSLRRKVELREWQQRQREQDDAVDELYRSTGRERLP